MPSISPPALDDLLLHNLATKRSEIGTSKVTCAIQAAAGSLDTDLYQNAFGKVDLESPDAADITTSTPFDIASITKALVGSTLAMQAIDEDRIQWHTPIAEILPAWRDRADKPSADVTFLQILNHSSGLPAWRKFYLEYPLDPSPAQATKTRQAILDAIISTPLHSPPGQTHLYSDLGYLLLAHLLEVLFDGRSLHQLASERIFEPLNLGRTSYVDAHLHDAPISDAVVTEDCPRRHRLIRGTVHDENTNIIGGVSTHAGVFSTANQLLKFGRHLLAIDLGQRVENPLVTQNTLHFAWSNNARATGGSHLAGWDTPSGELSSAGRGFHPEHSIGHLGFTGTSLWIERHRSVISVLLTNRVYPTRNNDQIRALRIAFQEAILPPD